MHIGPYALPNRIFVAPMAGVTDRPFRTLCKRLGAGYAVSEMVTSRPDLQKSLKTSRRANHDGETAPIAVQIAGTDAPMMADAARHNIDRGAQIIDINMGCPAKKVCNKWAGSALMQDENLALEIVAAVVQAAAPHGVPVTLKMRTGWCASARNAPRLALAAQEAGIAMLTVHGRTREQGYQGQAEHDTVAGRAAQGRPWIFREITHFLETGEHLPPPTLADIRLWLIEHLHEHYALYGEYTGVRSARKHLGWYVDALPLPDGLVPDAAERFRQHINTLDTCEAQLHSVTESFDAWQAGLNAPSAHADPLEPLNWKLAA
jgi:tRNA-dihydrouridine synthase B